MEAFPPFSSPPIAHFMLFALPFAPHLAAELCAVRGDIAFEGKFVPDIHVQFAQANLLSISEDTLIKEYSYVNQYLMIK